MSLKEQWYKGRLQNQKLVKQIQQSVKQMQQTAVLDKQQRQTDLGISYQGVEKLLQAVRQLLNDLRQEDIQRQNKTQEMHQEALADKGERQTEIAERKEQVEQEHQEALADKGERQTEIAARKQYVWGDQAGLVGLSKSEMSQPMQPHSSDNSHQDPEHHEQYQGPEYQDY